VIVISKSAAFADGIAILVNNPVIRAKIATDEIFF